MVPGEAGDDTLLSLLPLAIYGHGGLKFAVYSSWCEPTLTALLDVRLRQPISIGINADLPTPRSPSIHLPGTKVERCSTCRGVIPLGRQWVNEKVEKNKIRTRQLQLFKGELPRLVIL
jgi:hypothetical protein